MGSIDAETDAAGRAAPPGRDRRVEAPGDRTIAPEHPDARRTSPDGRVALHRRRTTGSRAPTSAERASPHRGELVGPA